MRPHIFDDGDARGPLYDLDQPVADRLRSIQAALQQITATHTYQLLNDGLTDSTAFATVKAEYERIVPDWNLLTRDLETNTAFRIRNALPLGQAFDQLIGIGRLVRGKIGWLVDPRTM